MAADERSVTMAPTNPITTELDAIIAELDALFTRQRKIDREFCNLRHGLVAIQERLGALADAIDPPGADD